MQDDDPAPGKHPDPLQYLAGALDLLRLSERVTTVGNVVHIHMPEGADLDAMRLALRLARAKQLDGIAAAPQPSDPPRVGRPDAMAECPLRGNAERQGWAAFQNMKPRGVSPFPLARKDLAERFRIGWDAAKAAHDKQLGEISP